MGLGDVNSDGRLDLLEKDGWWEQPTALAGDPLWQFHAGPFGLGGSHMFAYDVNGDGLNDVITALTADAFGFAWFEQYREGGEIRFREHILKNKEPGENRYGVKFSELHAIELVDMDGDGLKDIVTGKRFWSHGRTGDPDRNQAAVNYWFKLVRGADKSVDFVPHRIDDSSGVGTQLIVGDVDKNGLPDLVVSNKKGTFVLLHEKKTVTKEEWEQAQPKPVGKLRLQDAHAGKGTTVSRLDWVAGSAHSGGAPVTGKFPSLPVRHEWGVGQREGFPWGKRSRTRRRRREESLISSGAE